MSEEAKRKPGRPVGSYAGKHPKKINKVPTRAYTIWMNMNVRCDYAKSKNFKDYGGRGIKVCERWNRSNPQGFYNFVDDMGQPPDGLTLERKDNEGNYESENCKWATWVEQGNNRRVPQTADPTSLRQKAIAAGLPYLQVWLRINKLGWTEEKALFAPMNPRGRVVGWRKAK